MRIMELVSRGKMNGAVLHGVLTSRELARRGHHVWFVCPSGSWAAERVAGDPIRHVDSDLRRWPTDELRRLAAIVRRERIEVLHTHNSRAQMFGVLLAWLCGVPTVASANCRHPQPHWMLSDYVIAASEATHRYHRRVNLVRASRIETICNFIDHRRIAALSPATRPRVRESLDVADDELLLGTVGKLMPRKGQHYLIEAMPEILAARPKTRLVLVGQTTVFPRYVRRLRATADRLGVSSRLIWAGARNDVAELLAAMDLYVTASLEETLPLAILEAMAGGLPVVATTVGGIPECVEDGETGVLVPPGDTGALARAVTAVLSDPARRDRLGEAGRQRLLAHFTAESQVPRIEAVFRRVIARRRAARWGRRAAKVPSLFRAQ